VRAPKTLFLTLILLATILQLPLAIGDPGWLDGWNNRVKITIDSGDIDEALSNFPVLIYLSSSSGINGDNVSFVFDEVGANSLKIAVTESDGITECYVEVEKWDLGNKRAWLWTKISSISNITDTEIYLYYDNDHADNTDYVGVIGSIPGEKVWDTNFVMVQHMGASSSPIIDSTDNDNDGTETGNPIYQDIGKIGDAIDFDGAGDYFDCGGDGGDLDITGALTIEAWVKPDTFTDYQTIVGKGDTQYILRLQITLNTEIFDFITHDGAWHVCREEAEYSTGIWYYVTGVMAGSGDMELFINSVSKDTETGGITSNAIDVTIGENLATPGRDLDGDIDEVRISNTNRSNSWIKASYETQCDHLLDYGSEEIIPLEPPTYLFGAGFNASSPYVSLYWTSNLTGITLFEIQNSTDKVSWGYLGSNTTAEYHDFQVINGTERYYRVRACNFTGGMWDNSTWSDINFDTVYFIRHSCEAPAIVTVSMAKYYALAIILLILGILIGRGMRKT